MAEGYKRSAPHLVELFRVGAGHAEPLCAPGEALALVTDAPLAHEHLFGLDDAPALARFLARPARYAATLLRPQAPPARREACRRLGPAPASAGAPPARTRTPP